MIIGLNIFIWVIVATLLGVSIFKEPVKISKKITSRGALQFISLLVIILWLSILGFISSVSLVTELITKLVS